MANLTDMLSKFVTANTASTSGSGTLPGNTVTNPKEDLKANVAPVVTPVPKASIPFPSRRNDERRKEKANDQIEKFYEIFRDLSFEISFTDALMLMPNGHPQQVTKETLGDPRSDLYSICEFTGITTCNALADLGASINLMPYSVWKSLSLPELTPTCMTLELADRSITEPIGIAEDVFVNVGKFQFPADFVVVDFEHRPPEASHSTGPNFQEYTADYNHMKGQQNRRSSIWLVMIAILDSEQPPLPNHEQYMPGGRKELKLCEAKAVESSVNEPPEVELKELPPHLEYAFLEVGTPFVFSEECIDSFNTLKRKLTEAPILIAPDWDLPFELMCDASDSQLGQVPRAKKNKYFQPIHYASKSMTTRLQTTYTIQKRILAVVYALEKFRFISCHVHKSIVYIDSLCHKYLFPRGANGKNSAGGSYCSKSLTLMKVQLNELNELRDQAYENSLIYKEKTKKIHDAKIKNRVFNVGDRVLLFNSRLKIFSGKLKSRWSGPFTVVQVFPYGTVELSQNSGPNFKVNSHRIKHYFGGDVPTEVVPDLQTFPMDQ
ncbi:reverse transcriptase domain-containing protein [Tanacetum coccineum]